MEMENDRLLRYRVESDGGESYKPAGTPCGQLAIISLVLLCEPLAAFTPVPFFAQVKSRLSQVMCRKECLPAGTYLSLKLIAESGVTHGNPSKIGFYVGIVVRQNVPLMLAVC